MNDDSPIKDSVQTTCCIVGGGPAGVVLSLLLAQSGIETLLLEAHADFDRDFRGDTMHPATMELMDQLGLAERLLQLPHTKLHTAEIATPNDSFVFADFGKLRTKYPYITVVTQAQFLETLVEEAKKQPTFQIRMKAQVRQLIEEDGVCRGVRYREGDAWREVRAALTVAADGRFSMVRKLAGLTPISSSPPMDILWFRLPRREGDAEDLTLRVDRGHMLVSFNRGDNWQIGYVILKGSWSKVREEGLEAFRQTLRRMTPELADRVEEISDWKQLTPLSVESNRLPKWYKPGLLLIGDAAHVMSPVGGVGINYAIQDAVAAANVLSSAWKKIPISDRSIDTAELAKVQKQRELATKIIQRFQRFVQQRIIKTALNTDKPFRLPWIIRVPWVRNRIANLIALGWNRTKWRG